MNSKRHWITIDGGTTNTRVSLVNEEGCIFREKHSVGARNSSNGRNDALKERIHDSIASVLHNTGFMEKNIAGVVASGMIGSEAGLMAIPHIQLPVGEKELFMAIQKHSFPEICSIPFYFIPGVKTFENTDRPLCELDIMRGEETELIGLIDIMRRDIQGKKCTFLLPGSHMKIVDVDENGRIVSFKTSMSGELFRAICENTILKMSLADVFYTDSDRDYLCDGFYYAKAHGINETLFKVRVQALFCDNVTKKQLFSFLLGAVLHDDVKTAQMTSKTLVIAGSEPFKSALCTLLENDKVLTVSKEIADTSSAWGAYIIAEKNIK